MKAWLEKHQTKMLLVGFVLISCYWLASELNYMEYKKPVGVLSIADYNARFGPPTHTLKLHRDGKVYQELSGRLPHWPWMMAFPAARPSYIFDESGKLVEWFNDPGDSHVYVRRWRKEARVELESVKAK